MWSANRGGIVGAIERKHIVELLIELIPQRRKPRREAFAIVELLDVAHERIFEELAPLAGGAVVKRCEAFQDPCAATWSVSSSPTLTS